jgi:uracil phosphoribosyltransferase
MKKSIFALCLFFQIIGFSQTQALHQLVYEIRDPKTDPSHFRQALEKIGEYLAFNVLEQLPTREASLQTLTGAEAKHPLVAEQPVLVTILRAGLPLNLGVQKVFPNAPVGFLAMSRNEETFKAKVDYVALPDLKDQCVIISDTMLATGGSLLDAIQIIQQRSPKKIYVITAIAAQPGIERIREYDPNIQIFAAAIDPYLNHKAYIVPGLGDAGDRAFGMKHIFSQSKEKAIPLSE